MSNVKYIRKSLCTSPNRVFQHQIRRGELCPPNFCLEVGGRGVTDPPAPLLRRVYRYIKSSCVPVRSPPTVFHTGPAHVGCRLFTIPYFSVRSRALRSPIKGYARPVGTYETKMAGRARTGKRWMLTIGDCERSTAHATCLRTLTGAKSRLFGYV